jgi:hypothetical protein
LLARPAESLNALRNFVETEAQKYIDWYWARKNAKKLPSQIVQFGALSLTAFAGLAPIVFQVLKGA